MGVHAQRNHKFVTRTAGDITLNSTSIANVHTSLDMTLTANVGDVIEYGMNGALSGAQEIVNFDVYTLVGGSPVNPFGSGLSAAGASTIGVSGWYVPGDFQQAWVIGSSARRTLVSGDLSSGSVTLRLRYVKPTTGARLLVANTNFPLQVWAKNLGPAS